MALPSVTYSRYQELGGKLDQGAFDASCPAAVAAVREVIGFNEPQDDEDLEAYERAVCAAIAVDNQYGASGGIGERLSSVTLGRFSASLSSGDGGGASPYDADMERAITRELTGSTLLYQGLQ